MVCTPTLEHAINDYKNNQQLHMKKNMEIWFHYTLYKDNILSNIFNNATIIIMVILFFLILIMKRLFKPG